MESPAGWSQKLRLAASFRKGPFWKNDVVKNSKEKLEEQKIHSDHEHTKTVDFIGFLQVGPKGKCPRRQCRGISAQRSPPVLQRMLPEFVPELLDVYCIT